MKKFIASVLLSALAYADEAKQAAIDELNKQLTATREEIMICAENPEYEMCA